MQSLGIDAATPVVVVYEGSNSTDFGAAARVYWTLKAAGVKNLSILNGGVKAWRAANLPLTTEARDGRAVDLHGEDRSEAASPRRMKSRA